MRARVEKVDILGWNKSLREISDVRKITVTVLKYIRVDILFTGLTL